MPGSGIGLYVVATLVVAFGLGGLAALSSHALLPLVLPELGLMAVVLASPGLLALGLAARERGWAGVRALLGAAGHWRVPARWYLVALLLPVVINGTALLVAAASGRPVPNLPGALAPEQQLVPLAALPLYFLVPSLAEELGWRGYALARLQRRHSPFIASLVIGAVWAAWHLPFGWLAGSTQGAIPVGPYVVATVAMAVLFTWLYNHTGGSLLLVTLLHASVQASNVLLPVLPTATGGTSVYVGTVIVTLLLAGAVVRWAGPALGAGTDLPGRPRGTRISTPAR